MRTKNQNSPQRRYTDKEYIEGLKSGNGIITHNFFYVLCNYTLNDIRMSLMNSQLEYDDLVNELYIYLSEKCWHSLDTFAGLNGCSLKSWMNRVAWRYFLHRRKRLMGFSTENIDEVAINETTDDNLIAEIAMDVESTFARMRNKRYVEVLRWMLVDGLEAEEVAKRLDTSVANVYNIKHRAIVQFIETYN